MGFDEALADRESEPSAADATRHLTLDAMEPIKDSVELGRRQS